MIFGIFNISIISLFLDRFQYFFSSLTWKFYEDSKSDIVLSLKSLSGPQMSNFLVYGPIWIIFFFFDLEIRWEFQIRYCTLPQMTNWTTKVQFLLISWTSLLMDVVNLVSSSILAPNSHSPGKICGSLWLRITYISLTFLFTPGFQKLFKQGVVW